MKHIIEKDLFRQRFLLLGCAVGIIIAGLIPIYISALPHILLLFFTVSFTVTLNESVEEKAEGYTFLSTLPVSHLRIVIAKFLVILSECIFFSILSFIVMTLKGDHPSIFSDISTTIFASFLLNLVIGSIFQSGVYILGMKVFIRVVMVFAMLIQFYIFALSVETFAGNSRLPNLLEALADALNSPGSVIVMAALVAWAGMIFLTAQFRKRI